MKLHGDMKEELKEEQRSWVGKVGRRNWLK